MKQQLCYHIFRVCCLFGAALCLLVTTSNIAFAQPKSDRPNRRDKPALNDRSPRQNSARRKTPPGLTPAREAQVMAFANQHHAELAPLLEYLKEHDARAYENAFRDLFRASERLAQVQERDEVLYELELAAWKTKSRTSLIVARMNMEDSSELKEQLRAEVTRQHALRLRIIQHNRDRMAQRLKKIDAQLSQLEKNRDKEIDRQIKLLTGASKKGKKPTTKIKTQAKP